MAQKGKAGLQRFFVLLTGKTNGAHHDFITKLTGVGLTEVYSAEECNFVLAFCPIVTVAQRDIIEVLDKMPVDKPIILVVMHHTLIPDHVVPESRRLVKNPNVHLTVDCLFYEHHFLECNHNDTAWDEVQKYLEVSVPRRSILKTIMNMFRRSPESTTDTAPSPSLGETPKKSTTVIRQVSGNRFCVGFIGETYEGHRELVQKLKSVGHMEMDSMEKCDYIIFFCSDPTLDIDLVLLGHINKPAIVVLLHYTLDFDLHVAESKPLVENPNIYLTVDYWVNQHHFPVHNRNDTAWLQVQKCLGISDIQVSKCNRTRFCVVLMGEIYVAHQDFVQKLKGVGHTEVNSIEECDYILFFFSDPSQLVTVSDIDLVHPGLICKPTILVQLRHTSVFHHREVDSRRLVTNPNIHLTVDCEFDGHHFLKCKRNDDAWLKIKKYLDL